MFLLAKALVGSILAPALALALAIMLTLMLALTLGSAACLVTHALFGWTRDLTLMGNDCLTWKDSRSRKTGAHELANGEARTLTLTLMLTTLHLQMEQTVNHIPKI